MYQKLIIVGNVGREPEARVTASGTKVASFSVAVNKKRNGEDQTTWFRVATWDKLAGVCEQYVKKGMLVLCEGEIKTPEVYQKRDGTWGCSLEMTAWTVQFLSRVDEGAQRQQAAPAQDDDGTEVIPF